VGGERNALPNTKGAIMPGPVKSFEVGPLNKVSPGSAGSRGNGYAGQTGSLGESYTRFEATPLNTKLYSSYAGSDIMATIIVPGISAPVTFATLRTISYSIVRDKRPLRILGSMNPITWSKSNRLIAGTLVFTSFDRYIWFQLTGTMYTKESIVLADMLPPFDVSITAINEYSQISRLAIRGVRIVDEGAVIGVDDMYVEQTHTYVAQDIVPWIPTSTDEESVDK
jgi:hypothetical protein